MLRGIWDHSVGGWLFELKQKEHRRRWNNYGYHFGRLLRVPQVYEVRVTEFGSGQPPRTGVPTSPGSRLLNLPTEIRLLVWECVLGGNLLALYRDDRGRLAHILLDK